MSFPSDETVANANRLMAEMSQQIVDQLRTRYNVPEVEIRWEEPMSSIYASGYGEMVRSEVPPQRTWKDHGWSRVDPGWKLLPDSEGWWVYWTVNRSPALVHISESTPVITDNPASVQKWLKIESPFDKKEPIEERRPEPLKVERKLW